ncbi:MAG: VOC family protein [Candidatus Eisenbacteria bacterium]|nr:VOC family protein [Candidatus Eisenbacteria bacterium]
MKPFDGHITFCYTPDLEAAARFYGEGLQLPLVLDQGQCRIYRAAEGAYVGFCRRPDAGAPQGVILTFVTEDVDRWCERLRGFGAQIEKAPARNPEYRIYHCFLRDPSGYLVEIQRFDDPHWAEFGA